MNGPLAPTHRFILSALALSTVAVGVVYFLSGVAALLVAVTVCVLLWIFRPLLMPPGYGATKVRTLSVMGIFGLAASYGFWSQLVDTSVKALASSPWAREYVPWLVNVEFGSGPSISVLAFVAVGLWIVNHYLVDRSIAGGHPVPISTDFPEESFQRKLGAFCSALNQHLVTTDREANWSPEYYTDLEAEVEIVALAGSTEKKRVIDLQRAIRSDRVTRTFLVLGDPGAGKSVALRKLARDMLSEVEKTGRVPIYVNLREWLPSEGQRTTAWTDASEPSIQDLESFILNNIKARGDVFTEEFVDQYFRELWRHGRLFFIFDSFDEIPELLDTNEESSLINGLSDVLSRFISTNPLSRGLLASRVFRRPTHAFLAQKILSIRPLAEERIMKGLARFPGFTRSLQIELFRDRLDLVPVVRNPFLMALLGEWVGTYRTLPDNQGQLYKSYLTGRLAKCASRLRLYNLGEEDVLTGAIKIAWFVFESPAYGLEAPVRIIEQEEISQDTRQIIDVLSYARIARVTTGERGSFAFVHRRFLEYFVTARLLDHPDDLPVAHIPTDSRGRDALVLYAQLCETGLASRLAGLCWSEIQTHFRDPSTRLRAIHCLRFLIDAFRSRRSAVAPFEVELAQFITAHLAAGDDLLHAKICLEATGLLSEARAVPILMMAMEGNNSWLQETAFRACRHLPRLEPQLQNAIVGYVVAMPLRHFWDSRSSLLFSLSLSEPLSSAHRMAVWRYRNLLMSLVAFPLSFAIAPGLNIVIGMFGLQICLMILANAAIDERRDSRRTLASSIMSWQSLRMYFGVALVGCCVLMISSDSIGKRDPLSEYLLWQWSDDVMWFAYVSIVVLGLMLLDWPAIRVRSRGAIDGKFGESVVQQLPFLIVAALVASCIFLAIRWVEGMLKVWDLEWLLLIPVLLSGLMVGFLMLRFTARRLFDYLRDRRRFAEIRMEGIVSRDDIALALTSLSSKHWRLALIRELAQRKVAPAGSWPYGFQLSVGSDPVVTELARLEERWLRLDR